MPSADEVADPALAYPDFDSLVFYFLLPARLPTRMVT